MLFIEEINVQSVSAELLLWQHRLCWEPWSARQALTHVVLHIIVMFLQTCVHKLLKKVFQYVIKGSFEFLKWNFLCIQQAILK